ncbi:AI-2E family transporter [Oscillospiraceae bacterium LTW-04]|nr:AI-2E family transporter [Oscillospiraceae bacterium MB24-C1]
MKIEWNKKHTTIAVYALLVLMIVIPYYLTLANLPAVWMTVRNLFHPILPMAYGFVIAYLLNPIMVELEALLGRSKFYSKLKQRHQRALSLLLTYLLTIAVLVVFVLIVLPLVASNVAAMYEQLQNYVGATETFANELLERIPQDLIPQEYVEQLTQMAGNSIQDLINWMATSAPKAIGLIWQLGSGLIATFLAVVVSIYLLFAKERFIAQLRKFLCAFLSKKSVRRLVMVTRTTHMMFGRFITGKVIDSIIIGILCFVGLSIMQMPNAVLVSFIVGLTNVVPYFGPFIGAVPGFILIAVISPVQGLIFLIFILVLQQIDGNIIGPMILGDSTGLSAFWVVFAILFFGGMFGVAGMFIGVPTFGVIYALVKESITERLSAKGMPINTKDYIAPLEINDQE